MAGNARWRIKSHDLHNLRKLDPEGQRLSSSWDGQLRTFRATRTPPKAAIGSNRLSRRWLRRGRFG